MFNVFRIAGDLVHCMSIYLLLNRIFTARSVNGLSYKTQLLYCIVYFTRYIDILYRPWKNYYNLILKLLYLSTSAWTLWLMQTKFRSTLNPNLDTFKIRYLIGGSAVLALLFHLEFTPFELLWAFSIWLESFAILPQLFIVQRTGKAETLTTHYIFALGLYRGLYILNWIYRWLFTDNPSDWISVVGGLIQTGLYSDFFYVYYTKVFKGQEFALPT